MHASTIIEAVWTLISFAALVPLFLLFLRAVRVVNSIKLLLVAGELSKDVAQDLTALQMIHVAVKALLSFIAFCFIIIGLVTLATPPRQDGNYITSLIVGACLVTCDVLMVLTGWWLYVQRNSTERRILARTQSSRAKGKVA